MFNDSGGGDCDEALKCGSRPGHTLLYVHQEAWQRELLKKYGDFTMIDATYRTTMYDTALFFILVQTNVGYTVEAEFCPQNEGAVEIAERGTLFRLILVKTGLFHVKTSDLALGPT